MKELEQATYFEGIAHVEVEPLIKRSTDICFTVYNHPDSPAKRVVYVYSITAFILAGNGVRWHDDPEHCPTWAIACSCDVEPGRSLK